MAEDDAGPSAALSPLARARLDDLLGEVLTRVGDVLDTQERLRGLLDAVVGINADLSLERALERIVTSACELVGARYGALGVLGAGPGRRLREFVTSGLTPEERAAIGDLPRGHGILGVIIDRPEPLRLPVLGEHPSSYGFPPNHPPMRTFLGVPIRIRGRIFGNLYLTEKRGGELFTTEDEGVVVALAAAAGVVIENARLFEETARRQHWLEAAAEVTSALLTENEREDKLRQVAVLAREVPGADTAAVLIAEGEGRLRVVAVDGLPEDDLLGTALEVWGSHLADVLGAGGTLELPDIAGDDRVPHELVGPAGSLLLVPLRTTLTVSGVLAIGWSAGSEQAFRDTDVRLVEAYADQAALAMQVAQAREDRSRLAVFEDRDRIGRDLHDLVIQRLFAIGLTLENAGRLALRGEAAQRISTAVDDIDATIKDIRRTIFELSAPTESADLRAQVGQAVTEMTPALGLSPRVVTEGPVDAVVGDDVRPHLLAVRAEAAQRISTAVDDIDATIKDIRRTIFELSAPTESADLRAQVGQAVTEMTPALGFSPRVVTEGPVDAVIGDDVRPHLLAVLREALSNVARHAGASSVDVVLRAGDEVVLTVTDDGAGYRPGPRSSGVRNMVERAAALGGTCTVTDRDTGGTEVAWRVPARR